MPHVTAENKVVPDITRWQDYVKVPDIVGACSDPELWKPALEAAGQVDKDEKMVMAFMGTGIFEQCHYLMGFEDTLSNLLLVARKNSLPPSANSDSNISNCSSQNLKPDIILSHDDWEANTRCL